MITSSTVILAMDSSKLSALLLLMLFMIISSTSIALACNSCPTPSPRTPNAPIPSPKTPKGPITLPPIIFNPPIIGKPRITIPPIIGSPPFTIPPIIGSSPPINIPIITVPPIIGTSPPATGKSGCPPPPAATTCPVDALKFGACVDLLGSTMHIGDAEVECCPMVGGLAGVQAAACLCTTIKAKLLDMNVVLPIALQVLITCGNAAPPGYTCAA